MATHLSPLFLGGFRSLEREEESTEGRRAEIRAVLMRDSAPGCHSTSDKKSKCVEKKLLKKQQQNLSNVYMIQWTHCTKRLGEVRFPPCRRLSLFCFPPPHRWAWGRQLGGGSAKFRPGGKWFLDPRGGGNKFRLSEGGKEVE